MELFRKFLTLHHLKMDGTVKVNFQRSILCIMRKGMRMKGVCQRRRKGAQKENKMGEMRSKIGREYRRDIWIVEVAVVCNRWNMRWF